MRGYRVLEWHMGIVEVVSREKGGGGVVHGTRGSKERGVWWCGRDAWKGGLRTAGMTRARRRRWLIRRIGEVEGRWGGVQCSGLGGHYGPAALGLGSIGIVQFPI
jgi:hypothetical protein